MSAAPFMQLYVADYLGDTQHLTTEQHGAYLLLLMAMWRADGFLPNDPRKLARIARVNPRRWATIADDVMEFFDEQDGQLTQKRLQQEREKAVQISLVRSKSGKAGAEAKALKTQKQASANAKQMLKHSQISDIREEASSDEDASARAKPTPQMELGKVLDPGHVAAVIEYRKVKRSALTAYAAKLLANQLGKWPDPNAAADEMMLANWTGFKPAWMQRRLEARGQGPPANGHGRETPWQRQKRAFEELDDEISHPASPERPVPGLPKPGAH